MSPGCAPDWLLRDFKQYAMSLWHKINIIVQYSWANELGETIVSTQGISFYRIGTSRICFNFLTRRKTS